MTKTTTHAHVLRGQLQHYAWGGTEFLAKLLGRDNPTGQPNAEYWLGAHPKGPGRLPQLDATLDELIAADPEGLLGRAVNERFGELPFLFKVLDVKEMLSIQVHPTKAAAEAGFAREEASGPERSAPNRNYRDDNHKPELGVAVTDFYLLHGFRDAVAIEATLTAWPAWAELHDLYRREGLRALYARVMEADQATVDAWLQPVVDAIVATEPGDLLEPEYWVTEAMRTYGSDGHYDRGIFSIFWLNVVRLRPGQGIFQDAGVPHAYLRGVCLELMANSDNVLRGGLTPKHIDVPELLKHLSFDAVEPVVLRAETARGESPSWRTYRTPVPDFALSLVNVAAGNTLSLPPQNAPAIYFLCRGKLTAPNEEVQLDRDERALFVPASASLVLRSEEDTLLYRATVNLPH